VSLGHVAEWSADEASPNALWRVIPNQR